MKDKYDMQFFNHMLKKHKEIAIVLIAGAFILAAYLSTNTQAVSGGPFTPSETLDPDCVPGGTCVVDIPIGLGEENTTLFNVSVGTATGDVDLAASNTFLGNSAGSANTSGEENVALGAGALFTNTTASGSVAVGFEAGKIFTGDNSIMIGYQAGRTSSDSASFFAGFQAGYGSSGDQNIFIGDSAGYSNTGSHNIYLGDSVARTVSSGSNNVFIGQRTGENQTTLNNVTLIGDQASASDGLTNATAIGAQATVLQDNALILGNSADVGIGIGAPQAKLHLHTDGASSDDVLRITNSIDLINYAYLNIGKNSLDGTKETIINETGFGPIDTNSALAIYASTADATKYALRVGDLSTNPVFELRADGRAYFGVHTLGLLDFKSMVTINGELQLLDSNVACDADHVGAIKYEGDNDHFYGCRSTGLSWTQLDN